MRVCGADLGFSANHSAIVIGETGRILYMREWMPTAGALRPSVVCREIAAECIRWEVATIAADGFYRLTLAEELEAARVRTALVNAPAAPADAWLPTQQAFLEGRIILPHDEGLREELESVRFTRESGGRIAVHLETSADGAHSDKAAALALCVWLMGESADTGRMLGGRTVRTEYTRAHRSRFGQPST